MATKKAITGAAKAKKVIIPAPAVSVVATTEFPSPPVVAVDAARVPANPELIAAAVPPPAINASAQVGNVPRSVNCAANMIEPAIVAKGTEAVSNKWSTYGI